MTKKSNILLSVILAFANINFCVSFSLKDSNVWSRRIHVGSTTEDREPITFASYVIYKGKGAVSIKAIPPTFAPAGNSGLSVSREGGILFEFASSISQRQYDWQKKITFLADATECGDILIKCENNHGFDYFHDPNMGTDDQGKTTKKLKLSSDSTKGNFLTLQVTDKTTGLSSVSVPITDAELKVVTSIVQFSLPRILGFDKIWNRKQTAGYVAADDVPPPPPVWKTLD